MATKIAELSSVEKLLALRAQIEAVEAEHAAELAQELPTLPAKLGFDDMAALVRALIPLTNGDVVEQTAAPVARRGRKPRSTTATAVSKPSKGKRAKVDDKMRQDIINHLKDTGMTAKQIAEKFGVSMPTVNMIKKAAGLTKSRK